MYWWRIFLNDENQFLLVTKFFRLPWITSNYILTIDLIFWIKGTVHVIFAIVEAFFNHQSGLEDDGHGRDI